MSSKRAPPPARSTKFRKYVSPVDLSLEMVHSKRLRQHGQGGPPLHGRSRTAWHTTAQLVSAQGHETSDSLRTLAAERILSFVHGAGHAPGRSTEAGHDANDCPTLRAAAVHCPQNFVQNGLRSVAAAYPCHVDVSRMYE